MERIRVTITIVCVLLFKHQRIFGTEVNISVRPGDNVTLFCDCVIPVGFYIFWIKNNSYGNQSLLVGTDDLFQGKFPHFRFVLNSSGNSFDLRIENISVYDEGIYYCTKAEKIISTGVNGTINNKMEYQYGNIRSHLAVLDSVSAVLEPTDQRHEENMLIWTVLVSVCAVCVLLCSICVFCLCRQKKTTGSRTETQNKTRNEKEDEVYYASLHMASAHKQKKKKTRLRGSDFSVYSEVRLKSTDF